MLRLSILIGLFLGLLFRGSFAVKLSLDELDDEQKSALNGLRTNVSMERTPLPHDYMKNDEYLLKFLSKHDFSVADAASNLKQHLEWRRNENVDEVLEEDWLEMEAKFPYDLKGKTRSGNPILYMPVGKYNVREAIESGKLKKLKRYFGVKIPEDAEAHVRSLCKSGDKVLQYDVIYDLEGYSVYNLGCYECMQFERDLIQQTRVQYVRAADKTFVINTPAMLQYTYPFLADVFSWRSLQVLGKRDSYEPVLLQYIDKDDLPKPLK